MALNSNLKGRTYPEGGISLETHLEVWWRKPLSIVQYNLQVKDTPLMNPEKIAEDLALLGADSVVLNVGGIYAWYPSKVKYHHINEYLPSDYNLLKEVIQECHKKDIRVIARFDFSKTDDIVYLSRPWWFVKDRNKNPLIYGKDRMGEWSLLVTTCVNGGYRNEEVAMPILREVLEEYDIDGVFFNAPQMEECHCEACRKKYYSLYHKELPEVKEEFEPDWSAACLKENIGKLYKQVKEIRPEVCVILYYAGYEAGSLYRENLEDKYATADLVCTEAQDILSGGRKNLPLSIKPALNMKIGNMLHDKPKPFGIIHSSPGMALRHTGLPEAEYLYWMSQIPANQGNIWHSLTGFHATIEDKRILKNVQKINEKIKRSKSYMEEAKSLAQVLLIWNGGESGAGWADILSNIQCPFDLLDVRHVDENISTKYKLVVIPDTLKYDDRIKIILRKYIEQGGNLLIEAVSEKSMDYVAELCGIEKETSESGKLTASYMRFTQNSDCDSKILQKGLKDTSLLPLQEKVRYVKPLYNTQVLLTLVPPFAPLDGVGAPPERASLCVSHTDIPLCLLKKYSYGKVMLLPFEFSKLAMQYGFEDYYRLAENFLTILLGEDKLIATELVKGIQVTVYENKKRILIHIVNGIGERPLVNQIPYYNFKIQVKLPEGFSVKTVYSELEQKTVNFSINQGRVSIDLSCLGYWDMLVLE